MTETEEKIVTNISIPIYKICQLDENEVVKRIIVFYGKPEPVLSLSEVFSDLEIAEIEEQNTEIIFSKMQIHKDDTIETIKLKLVMELGSNVVSYNEIYIYSKINSSLFLENFYRNVTQNEQNPFTPNMLGQLLMNLQWDKEVVDKVQQKDNYTYEDLVKVVGDFDETRDILIPLGMRFSTTRNLLFSVNPFELLPSDTVVFEQSVDNPLLAFMNTTLLSYGNIIENKIYISFLGDVLEYSSKNNIDEKYVVQLYFPELKNENISTKEDFLQRKQEFINKNKKLITTDVITLHKTIDLFYNIQEAKTEELSYVNRGIQMFEIIFHPETKVLLPLEAIFKNVHATKKMPYIKYNPGNRRENIYRFYYEKISTTGKKIPFLKKTKIVSLSKITGKGRQISFFIEVTPNFELFVDMDYNGNVTVRGDSPEPVSLETLNTIFKDFIEPFINEINSFLQQSGYKLTIHSSLDHETVEIVKMKYKCEVVTPKSFELKKYIGCLTSIFEITESNIRKGASLRFKRVDNYRKMNAIQSMITEVFNRTNDEVAVINTLIANYNLSNDEATAEFVKYLNEHNRIQGKYVNKSVDIVDNPGFPTLMKLNMENLVVEIENIQSTEYIELLNLYIDSFLQITQIPEKLKISPEIIQELCLRQKEQPKTIEENKPETVIIPVIDKIQPLQFAKKYDEDEDLEEELDEDDEFEGKIFFDEDEDEQGQEDEEDVEEGLDEGVEEDEEREQEGGIPTTKDTDDNYSRYFLQKKKKLEPTLFLTAKEGQYKAYTRACPLQRQPVILTDDEKQKIDKENRDAYSYAIKYGTNPDKKYWYMCPRFWCMKTNQPLTEEDVKNGQCEGSIREFTSEDHIKNGKYVNHYPGFLPKDTHPTSCVPCCMKKNWDTNVQQKIRREECNIDDETDITRPEDSEQITKAGPPTQIKKSESSTFYIVGFDKYPIPKERWGFLPPSIQLFLQINYNDVIVKKTPSLIRNGSTTFLRYGVEQSINQSFLGCIADIYGSVNRYKEDNKPIPTINEFRSILQNSITLDLYIKCHNGSLVSIFQPKRTQLTTDVILKYENTEFYKKINRADENQMDFLEDTIASFENFLKFLSDKDSLIDHTYMWDVVTSNNTKLFPNGLNLVIMEIADNDITDNVEILCPTNSYIDKFYDTTRETVIILKHNEYYEPIYMYNIVSTPGATDKTVNTRETFSSQMSPPELKRILSIIQKTNNKYCKALPSMPKIYQFKQNITSIKLLRVLKTYQYIVTSQVANYRGKIIGLMVGISRETQNQYFIPSFPSQQIADIPIIYMDDIPWQEYEKTRDFLISVAKTTKNEVLCNPAYKVVEQNLIIGIFTETNQYIQIDKPIANDIEDDIPIYNSVSFSENGYFTADKIFAIKTTEDTERTKLTRQVFLETQFYTAFRTTIRIILNEFKNREVREKIIEWIEDENQFYNIKLKKIEILLQTIMGPHIIFNNMPQNILDELGEISTCVTDCKTKKYCLVDGSSDKCVLILPKINLITNENNEKMYYSRLSDELLRYKRIQMFLLKPKKYLNIADTEYKINNDEFIVLQSLLNNDYFDNLIPVQLNKYAKNIPYDVARPSISQKYTNDVSLQDQVANEELRETNTDTDAIIECIQETLPTIIGNDKSYWKKTFPSGSQEIVFNNTKDCTFYLMIDIIFKQTNVLVSISNLKTALIRKYREFPQHTNIILAILAKQGSKKKLIDKVVTSRISFEDLIISEEYYLTNLDLWALSSLFKLPVLLFSTKNLENLLLNVNWVILGGNRNSNSYYCIRSSVEKGVIPQYHLIKPAYKLSSLNNFEGMINNDQYAENNLSFETYLNTHIPSKF